MDGFLIIRQLKAGELVRPHSIQPIDIVVDLLGEEIPFQRGIKFQCDFLLVDCMTFFLSGTVRKAPGGSPFIVFFCQVAIVAALPPGQVLHHAVPALIGSLNVGGGPAPGKIVVGADLDFLDLRVALQKSVQRKGVLGLPFLPLSYTATRLVFPFGGRRKQNRLSLPGTSALKGSPRV